MSRRFLAGLLGAAAFLLPCVAGAMNIKEIVTPLGIKAWLVEDRSVPIVSLSFSFQGGTAGESRSQRGITSLMATLLTDGAGSLDAQAFRKRLEDASVALSFSASHDRFGGGMRLLSANRQEAFELLALALAQPRFDAEMVDRRRAQVVAAIGRSNQQPTAVAERTLTGLVFAGHPYAIYSQGVREALKTLTVEDVRVRAKALIGRDGLIVAAVGDIGEVDLARELDRVFAGVPAGEPKPALPSWTPPAKARTQVVERAVPQSAVRIALPAVARSDPDWYAAFVMNHLLGGGGQQSRLYNEVRERRGLAYGVSSAIRLYDRASLLVISTASANERVTDTLRVIRQEMARLRNEGVGEQELADAKAYLVGSLPVSLDSSGSIAGLLHGLQAERLPRDFLDRRASLIGAVTAEDVRKMARRLLRDELATTVVVGKPVGLPAEQP